MNGELMVIAPDDRTLIEIAALAARSGVVLVERGGVTALCGITNIPPDWHRISVGVKTGAGNVTAV